MECFRIWRQNGGRTNPCIDRRIGYPLIIGTKSDNLPISIILDNLGTKVALRLSYGGGDNLC